MLQKSIRDEKGKFNLDEWVGQINPELQIKLGEKRQSHNYTWRLPRRRNLKLETSC